MSRRRRPLPLPLPPPLPPPPPITIGNITWEYLGSGNYNHAYYAVIEGQKKVYKIPKAVTTRAHDLSPSLKAMDTPKRAVRLWTAVNPGLAAENYAEGWIAPFIEGTNPTPEEICCTIVDLYQRTGRVLADAMSPGNFKKTKTGAIVCVDVGAALKLERALASEKSEASLNFWQDMKAAYATYFQGQQENSHYGPIGNMTKALLVLQQFRPDVRDVSSLKNNPQLVWILSQAYNATNTRELPVEIYQKFPINLDYFSRIPLLHDIVSAENFSRDRKIDLCLLYLRGQFSRIHQQLFVLLTNRFHLGVFNVIQYIQSNNIEQAGTLLGRLAAVALISDVVAAHHQVTQTLQEHGLLETDGEASTAFLQKPEPAAAGGGAQTSSQQQQPPDQQTIQESDEVKSLFEKFNALEFEQIDPLTGSNYRLLDHRVIYDKDKSSEENFNFLIEQLKLECVPGDMSVTKDPKWISVLKNSAAFKELLDLSGEIGNSDTRYEIFSLQTLLMKKLTSCPQYNAEDSQRAQMIGNGLQRVGFFFKTHKNLFDSVTEPHNSERIENLCGL